jgi:hypothetical protein
MIIQVSEKHATGGYGKITADSVMKDETLVKHEWPTYIAFKNDINTVSYYHLTEDKIYVEKPYGLHKVFKKNTVITFTQNSLS